MQAGLPQSPQIPHVLYEDNHVLAVYKPAGWQTQPGGDLGTDLMDWAKSYLKEKYQKPGNVFLGLVHRLDTPVPGVVAFGRTSKGASRLSESFRLRETEKIYWAWVEGAVPESTAPWKAYLSREANPRVEVFETPQADTVEAVMEVKTLKVQNAKSLLEIQLGTGRKHQIRAMLAHRGFPILGDTRYGKKENTDWGKEIALLAKKLVVAHPVSKEVLTFEVDESPWMRRWQ